MSAPRRPVRALCLRLCTYAGRRKAGLAALLVTMLVEIGLNLLRPWPLKVLVDNVLDDRPAPAWLTQAIAPLPGSAGREGLLTWTVAATLVLFLGGWAVGLAREYASVAFGQRMVYDLAGDLLRHMQRLSLRFHTRRGTGDLVRRVTSDTACVSTIVQSALVPSIVAIVTVVMMTAIMWRLSPPLTLVALGVVPLLALALKRFSEPMVRLGHDEQNAYGHLYEVVEQRLSGITTVQAYRGERDGDRAFRAASKSILGRSLAVTAAQIQYGIWVGAVTALGTALVLLVGGHLVLDGDMSLGVVLVFLAYLAMLYAPLSELMQSSSSIHEAAGSALRVMEVLDLPADVTDAPGARALGPVRGWVRLEGVSFGYDPDRPVLREVSLSAPPGSTVAVVGPTGAGKSTLVGLVLRLFDPDEGRVTLDGVDLRDVRLDSVRSQVSLVLQESFLFPVSVADNIRYGRPGASMEEVVEAAKAANAHEFIHALPDGYATVLGERGATLSGGQRQRISIARALAKNAPVLVLDEPTSAVDAQTEAALLQALERLMHNRTTLVIAHRLSTIRNADSIVVLDHGRVVETGTHDQLLAHHGLYSQLHAAHETPCVLDLTAKRLEGPP